MLLAQRVSIVTGASQGIGEAIAQELAQQGASVALVDIQQEKLQEVAQKIKAAKGEAWPCPADVTSFEEVARVVDEVLNKYQRIDHLVNNAGITKDNLLMRMKEEEWDAVLAVNLKGVFNFCRAAIRSMVANRYGRIVNISSVVGLMGNAGQANYAASKAGIVGFTKSLAREVASRGITVNAVAPGYVATSMTNSLPEAVKQRFLEIIPLKRFGWPKEVAHLVKFLVSDEAAYITGQVININGGMFM